eukprot:Rmarinus@m.3371
METSDIEPRLAPGNLQRDVWRSRVTTRHNAPVPTKKSLARLGSAHFFKAYAQPQMKAKNGIVGASDRGKRKRSSAVIRRQHPTIPRPEEPFGFGDLIETKDSKNSKSSDNGNILPGAQSPKGLNQEDSWSSPHSFVAEESVGAIPSVSAVPYDTDKPSSSESELFAVLNEGVANKSNASSDSATRERSASVLEDEHSLSHSLPVGSDASVRSVDVKSSASRPASVSTYPEGTRSQILASEVSRGKLRISRPMSASALKMIDARKSTPSAPPKRPRSAQSRIVPPSHNKTVDMDLSHVEDRTVQAYVPGRRGNKLPARPYSAPPKKLDSYTETRHAWVGGVDLMHDRDQLFDRTGGMTKAAVRDVTLRNQRNLANLKAIADRKLSEVQSAFRVRRLPQHNLFQLLDEAMILYRQAEVDDPRKVSMWAEERQVARLYALHAKEAMNTAVQVAKEGNFTRSRQLMTLSGDLYRTGAEGCDMLHELRGKRVPLFVIPQDDLNQKLVEIQLLESKFVTGRRRAAELYKLAEEANLAGLREPSAVELLLHDVREYGKYALPQDELIDCREAEIVVGSLATQIALDLVGSSLSVSAHGEFTDARGALDRARSWGTVGEGALKHAVIPPKLKKGLKGAKLPEPSLSDIEIASTSSEDEDETPRPKERPATHTSAVTSAPKQPKKKKGRPVDPSVLSLAEARKQLKSMLANLHRAERQAEEHVLKDEKCRQAADSQMTAALDLARKLETAPEEALTKAIDPETIFSTLGDAIRLYHDSGARNQRERVLQCMTDAFLCSVRRGHVALRGAGEAVGMQADTTADDLDPPKAAVGFRLTVEGFGRACRLVKVCVHYFRGAVWGISNVCWVDSMLGDFFGISDVHGRFLEKENPLQLLDGFASRVVLKCFAAAEKATVLLMSKDAGSGATNDSEPIAHVAPSPAATPAITKRSPMKRNPRGSVNTFMSAVALNSSPKLCEALDDGSPKTEMKVARHWWTTCASCECLELKDTPRFLRTTDLLISGESPVYPWSVEKALSSDNTDDVEKTFRDQSARAVSLKEECVWGVFESAFTHYNNLHSAGDERLVGQRVNAIESLLYRHALAGLYRSVKGIAGCAAKGQYARGRRRVAQAAQLVRLLVSGECKQANCDPPVGSERNADAMDNLLSDPPSWSTVSDDDVFESLPPVQQQEVAIRFASTALAQVGARLRGMEATRVKAKFKAESLRTESLRADVPIARLESLLYEVDSLLSQCECEPYRKSLTTELGNLVLTKASEIGEHKLTSVRKLIEECSWEQAIAHVRDAKAALALAGKVTRDFFPAKPENDPPPPQHDTSSQSGGSRKRELARSRSRSLDVTSVANSLSLSVSPAVSTSFGRSKSALSNQEPEHTDPEASIIVSEGLRELLQLVRKKRTISLYKAKEMVWCGKLEEAKGEIGTASKLDEVVASILSSKTTGSAPASSMKATASTHSDASALSVPSESESRPRQRRLSIVELVKTAHPDFHRDPDDPEPISLPPRKRTLSFSTAVLPDRLDAPDGTVTPATHASSTDSVPKVAIDTFEFFSPHHLKLLNPVTVDRPPPVDSPLYAVVRKGPVLKIIADPDFRPVLSALLAEIDRSQRELAASEAFLRDLETANDQIRAGKLPQVTVTSSLARLLDRCLEQLGLSRSVEHLVSLRDTVDSMLRNVAYFRDCKISDTALANESGDYVTAEANLAEAEQWCKTYHALVSFKIPESLYEDIPALKESLARGEPPKASPTGSPKSRSGTPRGQRANDIDQRLGRGDEKQQAPQREALAALKQSIDVGKAARVKGDEGLVELQQLYLRTDTQNPNVECLFSKLQQVEHIYAMARATDKVEKLNAQEHKVLYAISRWAQSRVADAKAFIGSAHYKEGHEMLKKARDLYFRMKNYLEMSYDNPRRKTDGTVVENAYKFMRTISGKIRETLVDARRQQEMAYDGVRIAAMSADYETATDLLESIAGYGLIMISDLPHLSIPVPGEGRLNGLRGDGAFRRAALLCIAVLRFKSKAKLEAGGVAARDASSVVPDNLPVYLPITPAVEQAALKGMLGRLVYRLCVDGKLADTTFIASDSYKDLMAEVKVGRELQTQIRSKLSTIAAALDSGDIEEAQALANETKKEYDLATIHDVSASYKARILSDMKNSCGPTLQPEGDAGDDVDRAAKEHSGADPGKETRIFVHRNPKLVTEIESLLVRVLAAKDRQHTSTLSDSPALLRASPSSFTESIITPDSLRPVDVVVPVPAGDEAIVCDSPSAQANREASRNMSPHVAESLPDGPLDLETTTL